MLWSGEILLDSDYVPLNPSWMLWSGEIFLHSFHFLFTASLDPPPPSFSWEHPMSLMQASRPGMEEG